jgi:hypothetical protein
LEVFGIHSGFNEVGRLKKSWWKLILWGENNPNGAYFCSSSNTSAKGIIIIIIIINLFGLMLTLNLKLSYCQKRFGRKRH